ncbi:MAG: LytTR family transcriptional regulator [Saprospiraceae bacterium]|nr:LytTR family transcriptional regulator [Saprospiraceae bacterium]
MLTKVSIGYFFKVLPPGRFLQVHKSFLAAKDKIRAYTSHSIEVGDREIPVGRIYKENFLRTMENESDL